VAEWLIHPLPPYYDPPRGSLRRSCRPAHRGLSLNGGQQDNSPGRLRVRGPLAWPATRPCPPGDTSTWTREMGTQPQASVVTRSPLPPARRVETNAKQVHAPKDRGVEARSVTDARRTRTKTAILVLATRAGMSPPPTSAHKGVEFTPAYFPSSSSPNLALTLSTPPKPFLHLSSQRPEWIRPGDTLTPRVSPVRPGLARPP
jgi:hypothetical protein